MNYLNDKCSCFNSAHLVSLCGETLGSRTVWLQGALDTEDPWSLCSVDLFCVGWAAFDGSFLKWGWIIKVLFYFDFFSSRLFHKLC